MEKDLVKKFTRYLKDNGSYAAFISNFRSYEGTRTRLRWAKGEVEDCCFTFNDVPDRTFKSYCKELLQAGEILNFAFKWDITLEGFKYWQTIASIWKARLRD